MNTFTKGPWRIDAENSRSTILSSDNGFPVAEASYPAYKDFRRSAKEIIANANLIAAAPELYEALKALYEHCAMVHKHWGEGCNQKQADIAIRAGQAAIAKAEGGKHEPHSHTQRR